MVFEKSGFQLPEIVHFEEGTLTNTYGKLVVEPLERGFGTTFGNSLRRVLLSSLEGAAVTSVKIEGVYHEFSTIQGVKEDVVQIILNLKKVRFKMHGNKEVIGTIDGKDKDGVRAADIKTDARIELLNPEEHIATLDKGAEFKGELRINKGRGYQPSENVNKDELSVGTVAIDAIFTPIKKVVFNVEKTRVGKATDYDKLVLEIWTDGSTSPKEALKSAARIIIGHMKFFLLDDEGKMEEIEPKSEKNLEQGMAITTDSDEEFNRNLLKTIDELELSVRAHNCLKNAEIKHIYELVQKTEHEMLKTKNFGRKSFNELREILHTMGLDFNMRIDTDIMEREMASKN